MVRLSAKSIWQPRTLLAGSAVADLVVRLPEDIILPLLSIGSGVFGTPAAGFLTTWAMFAAAVYAFTPLVFERTDPPLPSEAPGFKLSFTLGTIAAAILITRVFTSDGDTALLVLSLVVALAGGCLLTAYLVFSRGWELYAEDGRFVGLLGVIVPGSDEEYESEVSADFAREGWLGRFARSLYPIGATMSFSIVVLLASFAIANSTLIFPFPDIFFLAWAISTIVVPRFAVGPGRDRILNLEFEFDRYLLDALEHMSRGMYGMAGTFYLMFGLISGLLPLVVITAGGYLSALPRLASFVLLGIESGVRLELLVVLWNVLGVFFVATFGGLFGGWIWIREFQRFPYFLNRVDGTISEGDPPARATGFVLIPILSVLGSYGFAAVFASDRISATVQWSYAVLWPTLILVGLATYWHTLRRPCQSIKREYAWVVGGVVGQVAVIAVDYEAVRRTRDIGSVMAAVDGGIFTGVLLILLSAIPLCSNSVGRPDGIRRYDFVLLVIILGGVFLYGATAMSFGPSAMFAVGTAVCWIGAILCTIGIYYS
ncbi:hypothetical protein [Haloplanus sp. C73]|uniref:hypothetical protein n=1 Tax=Haloplanus sp. C73 TaxID=3421641 RepID=UPI003EB97539